MRYLKIDKFIEIESRLEITELGRGGCGELLLNEKEFLFGVMKIFGNSDDGCTIL